MTALLEHLGSRKLGVAVTAMILIAQLPLENPESRWIACLVAGIAVVHLMCQTWLDARHGRAPELLQEGVAP